jgi:hypothetical protein
VRLLGLRLHLVLLLRQLRRRLPLLNLVLLLLKFRLL